MPLALESYCTDTLLAQYDTVGIARWHGHLNPCFTIVLNVLACFSNVGFLSLPKFSTFDYLLPFCLNVVKGVRGRHRRLHQHNARREAEPASPNGGHAHHRDRRAHRRRGRRRPVRHEHHHRSL